MHNVSNKEEGEEVHAANGLHRTSYSLRDIGSFEYANRRYQINSDKDSLRLTDIKATGRVYKEIDKGPAPWPADIEKKTRSLKRNTRDLPGQLVEQPARLP